MVCHEPTGKAGRDEDSLYTPNGIGPFCEQCWDDAWPVMVPTAPDPALLALARFAALIVQRGETEEILWDLVLDDAFMAGLQDERSELFPSIADAIAALLAPDGTDGAGEVVRECKCRLRTRLVGDGCDVCNPELAAEYARRREATDGD